MKPGDEWDLYLIVQQRGETLWGYMRRFMKKKNTIPGVSNVGVMVAFLRKRLA